jgi:esterase/lipase superfamily enzyme
MDLNDALDTLAKLHKLYVEPEDSTIQEIVLFTWPAQGKLLQYRDDARDAEVSGYALARAYRKLQGTLSEWYRPDSDGKIKLNFCRRKIHLMAHSMGGRVVESMIRDLKRQHINLRSVFSEIVLVAADVDYDALESPNDMNALIDLGERVHIYYHREDKALGISETTKNAFNRLGKWGPKNTMKLADDIIEADVSAIGDQKKIKEGLVNHWYYLHSNAVVTDITEVFQGEVSVFAQ